MQIKSKKLYAGDLLCIRAANVARHGHRQRPSEPFLYVTTCGVDAARRVSLAWSSYVTSQIISSNDRLAQTEGASARPSGDDPPPPSSPRCTVSKYRSFTADCYYHNALYSSRSARPEGNVPWTARGSGALSALDAISRALVSPVIGSDDDGPTTTTGRRSSARFVSTALRLARSIDLPAPSRIRSGFRGRSREEGSAAGRPAGRKNLVQNERTRCSLNSG